MDRLSQNSGAKLEELWAPPSALSFLLRRRSCGESSARGLFRFRCVAMSAHPGSSRPGGGSRGGYRGRAQWPPLAQEVGRLVVCDENALPDVGGQVMPSSASYLQSVGCQNKCISRLSSPKLPIFMLFNRVYLNHGLMKK